MDLSKVKYVLTITEFMLFVCTSTEIFKQNILNFSEKPIPNFQ